MAEALSRARISINPIKEGILSGNRVALGIAISLVESTRKEDRILADELIEGILPRTGNSIRIGITGVPGVGKSTFIETFGLHLTSLQKKVAVLAIDPTSLKTKGSILGDKTRMDGLSKNPLAFIRPSSTGGTLGGVTNTTRESILLCEAAGFEVIIVETVGVGQSETIVREMTDFFLLLMLAGAGDELQGIKKGIMEMADGITITKADGKNINQAKRAQVDYQNALHLLRDFESGWQPVVTSVSALTNTGIAEIWNVIERFVSQTQANGFFYQQREQQDIGAIGRNLDEIVRVLISDQLKIVSPSLLEKIKSKQLSPRHAAKLILEEIPSLKKTDNV